MHVNTQITSPYSDSANYPVSVAGFKTYARIPSGITSEDTLIGQFIAAAATLFEKYTRRALITQTRVLRMDDINSASILSGPDFYISGAPIASITHIKFYDDENTVTTVTSSNYYLDGRNGRIALHDGYTWPVNNRELNAIEIEYICGYTDTPADLDPIIHVCIYGLVKELYDNRSFECDIPGNLKTFMNGFRIDRDPISGIDIHLTRLNSGSVGSY